MQRHAIHYLGLVALLVATTAVARPLYIPELRCRGTRPVIVDGVMSDEAYGCRVARDPESTPEPTPAPTPSLCAGKELQLIAGDEYGFVGRQIEDGATQTFCHTIPVGRTAIDFDVIDRTGATQCFWASNVTVTPPPPLSPVTSFGSNAHIGYWLSGHPLPAGSYHISVTARTDSGCVQRYGLSARSR